MSSPPHVRHPESRREFHQSSLQSIFSGNQRGSCYNMSQELNPRGCNLGQLAGSLIWRLMNEVSVLSSDVKRTVLRMGIPVNKHVKTLVVAAVGLWATRSMRRVCLLEKTNLSAKATAIESRMLYWMVGWGTLSCNANR